MSFFERVVNLRNTQFVDYNKKEFIEHSKALVRSYKLQKDEDYAIELMNMHEALFTKQVKRVNGYQNREDLLIALMEVFFETLNDYDPELSEFGYLISKRLVWRTNNFIRDELNKQSDVPFSDIDDYELVEDSKDEEEDDLPFEYYQLLDRLSPFERSVVESVVIGDMTCAEFARMEGIKVRSADDARYKAMKKLRKAYTEMKADGLF